MHGAPQRFAFASQCGPVFDSIADRGNPSVRYVREARHGKRPIRFDVGRYHRIAKHSGLQEGQIAGALVE
jgi:hypothetical protein